MAKADADGWETITPSGEPVANANVDGWETITPNRELVAKANADGWETISTKEERPEDQSFLRSVADVPLKVGAGAVSGVRLIADAFGAGSDISNTLKGAEDWVGALYSAQSKKDSKEVTRIMKDAEDKGVGDQVTAAIKAFSVAPVDLVSNALGTSAPAIVAGLGAALFGAPVLVGTGVAAGVGAAMGAGTIKGTIYDAVKEELSKTEMPPEQVEARAKLAQDYEGKNLGLILTGAALGTIGATTGFEPAAARQLAKQIATKGAKAEAVSIATREATEEAAKRGVLKHGAITGAKEFVGEAAEAGQEKASENIALQREGFDVPTMRGVAGAATLEGMAGLGLGAIGGGREASHAKKETAAIDAIANLGLPPPPPREAAIVLSGEVDPEYVAQLKVALMDPEGFGLSEESAKETAIEEATKVAKEQQENALAQRKAEGAADVTQPNAGPSGVSPDVAVQPGADTAPGGVGGTQPSGMVPAGPDAGQPNVREGAAPAAITPPPGAPAFIAQPQNQIEAAIAALQQPDVAKAQEQAAQAQQQPQGQPPSGAQNQLQAPQAAQESPQAPQAIQEPIQEAIQAQPQAAQQTAPEVIQAQQAAPEVIQAQQAAPEGIQAPVEVVAPVAEAPAKPKRGRPTTKTAEEVAANQSAAKRAYNERQKGAKPTTTVAGTDAAIKALDTALKPIDESKIETDEDLRNVERDKRIATTQAVKALLLLQDQLKPTDTAHGKVTAALSKISKKQIADVRTGIETEQKYAKPTVSRSETNTAVDKVEAGFSKATNGAQALTQVLKTGNGFQKFLAKRIRGFVSGVKFTVVEKGDVLPEQLQRHKGDWQAARGLFIQDLAAKTRTIYVKGASFGADQGANNATVLHELLHAATNQKLSLGLMASAYGFSKDAVLTRTTKEFGQVMINASDAYEAMDRAGKVPDDLRALVESTLDVEEDGKPYFKIFDLHQEFLAYGLTEPAMQDFLMTVDATQGKGSVFNRFVRAIMDFFGLGEKEFSAMTDLILLTDKILGASKTSTMRKLERIEAGEDYQTVLASAKQTKQKVDKTIAKLEKGEFADSIRDGGAIPTLTKLRNESEFVDALAEKFDSIKAFTMQQLLPAMQTSTIVQWATKLGVGGLAAAMKNVEAMAAMRNRATIALAETAEKLNKLAAKNIQQYKALARVMHFSTIVSKDPNTVTTDKSLTELWAKLTPETKKLYNEVREFYANNHKTYHDLLTEQIDASKLPGSASDPKSPKGQLIASIKQMYEDGKKLYPYFPLMRYGQYWASVGKGQSREFQMFEDKHERDKFVRGRVEQLNAASGNTRTQAEMIAGGDIDIGNDLKDARKKDVAASEMLKDIFTTLESKPVKSITDDFGNVVGNVATFNIEKLKDEIYQMYLQTLPDRNFRRQFMHRQGVAGFSGDIHRNFVTSGTNMASQLARIKYGPQIMTDIETASASLKGNPNKDKLGEFVTEMRLRTEDWVRPSSEDSIGHSISRALNTSAFLWMMTSVKTMVSQLTAVPGFVYPVLWSHHGQVKTVAALAKVLNVFQGIGITKTNPDGSSSYTMPSIANLKGLTADEKRAVKRMVDDGIADTTLAFDMGNRRDVPTAKAQGSTRRVMKATSNVMTALFHHGERMIREVTFLASYRLNRDKKLTHEEAITAAIAESHEALGNYHATERPRGLLANKAHEVTVGGSSPIGRSLLQFKMFPAFVTRYYVRNAYNMFKGLSPQERKQARIQFLGSLGMSYALAGYVGIPGISAAMALVGAILKGMKSEDDDDPLEGRDFEQWFRRIWLPQTFGNVEVGGHTMDQLLDKGLISGLTGYDITSSLSMNNMWFPEIHYQATAEATMTEMMSTAFGPGSTLITKQLPKAVGYFNKGEILRGFEQLMPAFFRGSFTAARYAEEGATNTVGNVIKPPEAFTRGELLAQAAGFVTSGVQGVREGNFAAQKLAMEVAKTRSELLVRLDKELTSGSNSSVDKIFEKITEFNINNPRVVIDKDQLDASLKKRMERRLNASYGFYRDKKYYPQLMEFLEPSTQVLEREIERNTRK